jgi:hypothetical protein
MRKPTLLLGLLAAGCSQNTETPEEAARRPAAPPRSAPEGRPAPGSESPGGSIAFTAPADWRRQAVTSSMRVEHWLLPRAEGDASDADVILFYFGPGGAGGVRENIDRWIGQMKDPPGKPREEKGTAGGFPVTWVDATGTYDAGGMSGGEPRPGSRMIAAVLETPRGPYFVKAVGPEKTMAARQAEVRAYVESVKLDQGSAAPAPGSAPATPAAPEAAGGGGSGPLEFAKPSGWREEKPSSTMRRAQFTLPRAEGDGEDGSVVVFHFGGEGGGVQANLDRWIGFVEGGKSSAKTEKLEVNGMPVTFLDVSGTYDAGAAMAGSGKKPDWRVLGAIIEAPSGNWFVRAAGPRKTMESHAAAFREYVQSARPGR